jgi:hypothetical protein
MGRAAPAVIEKGEGRRCLPVCPPIVADYWALHDADPYSPELFMNVSVAIACPRVFPHRQTDSLPQRAFCGPARHSLSRRAVQVHREASRFRGNPS